MHKKLALAAIALLAVVIWSRPAHANITITGTVGEIGIAGNNAMGAQNQWLVRFKLTDLNQTKTCNSFFPGYAWFSSSDIFYKEWYAALLVSKKGSTVVVEMDQNVDCHVVAVTLQ